MKLELCIDVTAAVGRARPHHIAATVHMPDPDRTTRPLAVMFAFPGGGYARRYFDLDMPGYSQAEHHTGRGILFVACDHLGVGESSVEGDAPFPLEMIAAANAAAVTEILRRLEAGTLAAAYPPLTDIPRIGIGQSMGGNILLLMQWRHRCFDAIAVLGTSAIQNVIPQRTPEMTEAGRAFFQSIAAAQLGAVGAVLPPPALDLQYAFHWQDVPPAFVHADMGSGYPIRQVVPAWASPTMPFHGNEVMARGFSAIAAAAITVPVLIALGERDTATAPHAEPAAYERSRDVSLFIAPTMAHMHNFAGTRRLIWDRLLHWTEGVMNSPVS